MQINQFKIFSLISEVCSFSIYIRKICCSHSDFEFQKFVMNWIKKPCLANKALITQQNNLIRKGGSFRINFINVSIIKSMILHDECYS